MTLNSYSFPVSLTAFSKFKEAVNKAKTVEPFYGTIVALDPGETTGFSVFQSDASGVTLISAGQLKTWPMSGAVYSLNDLIDLYKPDIIVYEQYAVYEWKTDDHAWSQVPTLRVIGCIETLCIQKQILTHAQTAQKAKHFCTDEKLKAWNVYLKGLRHARDSIRHGAYYLMFGPSKSS